MLPSFPSYRWSRGGAKGWLTYCKVEVSLKPLSPDSNAGISNSDARRSRGVIVGEQCPGERTARPQGSIPQQKRGCHPRIQVQSCQSLLVFHSTIGMCVCVCVCVMATYSKCLISTKTQDFLGGPGSDSLLPIKEAQVQSLVRELDPTCHS